MIPFGLQCDPISHPSRSRSPIPNPSLSPRPHMSPDLSPSPSRSPSPSPILSRSLSRNRDRDRSPSPSPYPSPSPSPSLGPSPPSRTQYVLQGCAFALQIIAPWAVLEGSYLILLLQGCKVGSQTIDVDSRKKLRSSIPDFPVQVPMFKAYFCRLNLQYHSAPQPVVVKMEVGV